MANVKDFIIDLDSVDTEGTEKKTTRSAPKVEYTLKVENDMDFVLNRKSARLDKDLVFLVSQDLFYIKDNKTNAIEKLEKDTFKRVVANFLKEIPNYIKVLTKTKWGTNLRHDKLYDVFTDERARVFYRAGIYGMSSWDMSKYQKYLSKNKKLFLYVMSKGGRGYNSNLLDAVFFLNENFNYNNAKYLLDKLEEINSPMLNNSTYLEEMLKILKNGTSNFDTNSYIDYIVNDLYSQGIDTIGHSIYSDYRDYLQMMSEMYDGKIKVKYPKHLRTDHDKLVLKYNYWKKYKNDLAMLKITEEYKKLEYKGKEFSIILPKNSADIVDEGVQQSNCVGSYVERIAKGDTFVCFMRKNEDLDSSFVTVEVKNNIIVQVKGFANRNTIKEEDDFLKKWAKEKELKVTYKTL